MQELGKTLKGVYEAMLTAYPVKDKKEGARNALAIYEENAQFIGESREALRDIDDLVSVLQDSLDVISGQRAEKVQIKRGSIVSKLVPCGKHCSGCPHGPYLYRVTKVEGQLVWKYLGKATQSQTQECTHPEIKQC